MERLLEDPLGRTRLDETPRVHHGHAVADAADERQVVADVEDGRAVPLLELHQQVEDARLDCHVQRGGQLVGDQELRIGGERLGDHHALFHPAR